MEHLCTHCNKEFDSEIGIELSKEIIKNFKMSKDEESQYQHSEVPVSDEEHGNLKFENFKCLKCGWPIADKRAWDAGWSSYEIMKMKEMK